MCVCMASCMLFLTESSLRELDVSFNKLGCLGVEQLLRCLRADVITSLNLTATIATHVANTLTRHLHVYLTQVRTCYGFQRVCTRASAYCFLYKYDVKNYSPRTDNNVSVFRVLEHVCAADVDHRFLLHSARSARRSVQVISSFLIFQSRSVLGL